MPPRRIIFWQPIDSPHQDAFLEAVAEQFSGEVILGVERPFPAERSAQGWPPPQHNLVKVVDISSPANHAALAAHTGPDSLHVFSGFFSHPLVWSGFRRLAPSRARLAIYSEAPEQPLLTGWLKRFRGRWLAARWAARIACILAVGGVGVEFFERIRFPKEKIVPFGYYLAVPPLSVDAPDRPDRDVFRFVSAGQLIHRKGIDLLIRACASLPESGWQLEIYGDGPERTRLQKLAASLGLASRTVFHGTVSNAAVRRALADADCAVLPSRFDGWGMLVNEALALGTPVICTDRCGAASLPDECGLRAAAPAATAAVLATALGFALHAGPPPQEIRLRAAAALRSHGSDSAAAARFLATVLIEADGERSISNALAHSRREVFLS
jgi:glycosyltransferase involved in cell wall biosynthesis